MDSKMSRVPGIVSSLLSATLTFEISGSVKSKKGKTRARAIVSLSCTEKRHAQDVASLFEMV